ncbi:hypothetical protein ACWEWX_11310 [Streptomyces asiaticus]
MTDTEAQLRARIAELEDQLAARPVIPALPAEHDGTPIDWAPWDEGIVSLCANLDTGCTTCNHPGPILLAFGLALPAIEPRRRSERGRKIRRFRAFRCRACQEQTVYDTHYDQYSRAHYDQIAYSPPRTILTEKESP